MEHVPWSIDHVPLNICFKNHVFVSQSTGSCASFIPYIPHTPYFNVASVCIVNSSKHKRAFFLHAPEHSKTTNIEVGGVGEIQIEKMLRSSTRAFFSHDPVYRHQATWKDYRTNHRIKERESSSMFQGPWNMFYGRWHTLFGP